MNSVIKDYETEKMNGYGEIIIIPNWGKIC